MRRDDLEGTEFDWWAADREGHVALFATAGYGEIPLAVLDAHAEPHYMVAIERIIRLVPVSGRGLPKVVAQERVRNGLTWRSVGSLFMTGPTGRVPTIESWCRSAPYCSTACPSQRGLKSCECGLRHFPTLRARASAFRITSRAKSGTPNGRRRPTRR
jgi:hypothetical protein